MRLLQGFIGNDDHDNLYNSFGHRCNEIDNLNFHNYVLFLGDNVALDLNKPIEDTYPYLISKALKVDYYNLSIFNGGVDCFRFNLLSWFNKFKETPPRFIVVSFEFLNAVMVSNHNYDYLNPADFNNDDVKDLYHYANLSGFFTGRNLLNESIISRHINVPIYQICFKDKNTLFNKNVYNISYDGPLEDSHSISELFVKDYKLRNSKVRP